MKKLLVFLIPMMGECATTGSLTLQGTVADSTSIVVVPQGSNNTTLNIISGEVGKLVAQVTESSNVPAGYYIQLSSLSGGFLVHSAVPASKTAYTLQYNGGLYTTPSVTATTVKTVSSLTQLTSAVSAVNINTTALPGALSGVYQDTITVSITAN